MNNFFDIFGPALIASFSSAVCYLVARRDFPPRDAVLVVIGVLIITVLQAGLIHLHVEAFWQQVAIGVVIIVAVWLDFLQRRNKA